MIESITPSKYRLLFALAIPVEKGNLGPRHRGAGETIGCAGLVGGPFDWWPEVTLRGRSAQQEAPWVHATAMCSHDSLRWLSKLSTTLLADFWPEVPFQHGENLPRERKRESTLRGNKWQPCFWRARFYCPRSSGSSLALPCCPVDVYCGILWSMVYIGMDYYSNNKPHLMAKCSHPQHLSRAKERSGVFIKSTTLGNVLSQKTAFWNRFWKKVWGPGAHGAHLFSPLWPLVVWLTPWPHPDVRWGRCPVRTSGQVLPHSTQQCLPSWEKCQNFTSKKN